MVLCKLSIFIAASSPIDWVSAVDSTMSVKRIVRSRRVDLAAAEKSIGDLRLDLDNFLRHQTVSFFVDLIRRFSIWRVDKAKNFSAALVHPIFQIIDAVLLLHLEIGGVRLCQIIDVGRAMKVVNV